LEQAVNILSLFSENVDIDESQIQYIRECEAKLNSSVRKMEEYKEREHVTELKKIIENNDSILSLLKVIIKKLNSETERTNFDSLLAEMSARDLELDKTHFVERQRNEYEQLTKQAQQIIDFKLKEFERLANVKYNQEALASYEKIFKIFKEVKNMKYVCPCGYVYDPELGDPDNGIAVGTPWDEVPEDWVCPICGLPKEEFEEVDE
jgi:rubredoxin